MPLLYRVSYQSPVEVHAAGGFQGHAATILPDHPSSGSWPAESFCAAIIEGLPPAQIRTVLETFSPPQAIANHSVPYLYRFEAADASAQLIGPIPVGAFKGVGAGTGQEFVVTVPVASGSISTHIALLQGWQPLGPNFNKDLIAALKAKKEEKE